MLILIPFPLFFAHTIYGVGGLTAWVVIGIIWCFCSAFTVVLYPLYESRVAITQIARGVIKVRILEAPTSCMILTCFFPRRTSLHLEAGNMLRPRPEHSVQPTILEKRRHG
jgi:hypothetical protein